MKSLHTLSRLKHHRYRITIRATLAAPKTTTKIPKTQNGNESETKRAERHKWTLNLKKHKAHMFTIYRKFYHFLRHVRIKYYSLNQMLNLYKFEPYISIPTSRSKKAKTLNAIKWKSRRYKLNSLSFFGMFFQGERKRTINVCACETKKKRRETRIDVTHKVWTCLEMSIIYYYQKSVYIKRYKAYQ